MTKIAHPIAINIKWALLINVVCLMFLCLFVQPSIADDSSLTNKIGVLEDHYFEHEYASDSVPARLDRLEKMVFGEAKTGADSDRLKALTDATVALGSDSGAVTPKNNSANTSPIADTSKSNDNADASKDNQETSTASAADLNKTDYPSVDKLEQQILGKKYVGQPIRKRLDRLEAKAFGHASGVDDLSERVSRLNDYADAHNPNPTSTSNSISEINPDFNSNQASSPYSSSNMANQSITPSQLAPRSDWVEDNTSPSNQPAYIGGMKHAYSKKNKRNKNTAQTEAATNQNNGSAAMPANANQTVSNMEMQVFNRTFSDMSIPDRLNNLEVTMLPNNNAESSLPVADRLNRLQAAIAAKQQYQAQSPGQGTMQQNNSYGTSYGSNYGTNYGSNYGTSYGSSTGSNFGPSYSSNYGSVGTMTNTQTQNQQMNTNEQQQQNKGHPLLAGIGRALGMIGSMATRSMMYSGMGYGYSPYNYGYGGMGYGYSPYSYGSGYGSSGYSPYGYRSYSPYGYGNMMGGGMSPFGMGGIRF